MLTFHAPDTADHDPQFFLVRGRPAPSPEQPERAARLLARLHGDGHDVRVAPPADDAALLAVHTPQYLSFLDDAWREWQALDPNGPPREVIANVHPGRDPATYPESIVGRAGWHMADTACPLGEHTARAARASAGAALAAADAVRDGASVAYALCRPPGHHAFADRAGGFCFVNNAAVAAARLREVHSRVAVVDIDVHHGNGTQGIFWSRGDVLTVSTHADPTNYYPFFWGHAHERGPASGEGAGCNLNLPLAHGSGDAALLVALDEAGTAVRAFAPGAVVLALGLDAAADDPLGVLNVSEDGFRRACARVAGWGLPVVVVQEGGYLCDALSANLGAALEGLEGGQVGTG